jgi:hypothetical protein
MKRLHFETGGRPLFNNDLDIVQTEILAALEAEYSGKGAFIVNGCSTTSNSISSGIVFMDGKIMRFEGASSVSFPIYLVMQEELLENETYETGGIKPTLKNIKAIVSTTVPSGAEYITMTASGGRTYNDVMAGTFVRLQGTQTIGGAKTFSSKIQANSDIETTVGGKKITLGSLQSDKADKTYVDSYFIYRGSGGDTNNYTEDGYANGRPFSANHPPGASHGTLFVYGRSASGTRQIFMDDYSHIWTRAQRWDGVWSSWVKQWDDQNFNPALKADKSYTDTELGKKADKTTTDSLQTQVNTKANKSMTWTSVTWLNSATGTLQYAKDDMGVVHFRGYITSISSFGSAIFTMPTGYRPHTGYLRQAISCYCVYDNNANSGMYLPVFYFEIDQTNGECKAHDRTEQLASAFTPKISSLSADMNAVTYFAG